MRSVSTRFTGLLLVALGVWGGLVPFVGHYFHFALGPDKSWDWTTNRLYLDVLPAAATILGGLNLMSAGPRRSARLGALLALAGGVWFTIGPEISQLWTAGGAQGAGHGSAHIQMLEMLTYHTGLGVLVAALAAHALPRFPVVQEAAPGRGRVAAAGAAGAGAGAVAGSRGDRWYHEPGALEDPASQREQAAGDGVDERDAQATHAHHRHEAEAAAVGAGALAHHEHEKHEAEGAEGDGGDARAVDEGDAGATRAHHRHEAEAAAVGAVGAGALAHHEHEKHEAEREAVADRQEARGTVTGRDGAGGDEPVANGARGDASTSVGGVQGEPQPAATSTYAAADQPTARRRRGGLLSSLLRR